MDTGEDRRVPVVTIARRHVARLDGGGGISAGTSSSDGALGLVVAACRFTWLPRG